MARGRSAHDQETLQMALVGYQSEKHKIDEKIREIQSLLQGKPAEEPAEKTTKKAGRKKRVLSAAARRRISAAQKKRWAEHRKGLAQGKA